MKTVRLKLTEVRGIRFPIKLWKELAERAEQNGRTIAREIIHRLQQSLKHD